MSPPMAADPQKRAWFDGPDPTGTTATGERGLRFSCTQCGNCCTGPTGFVLFTRDEARAMAREIGVTLGSFMETYTRDTIIGRSLKETHTEFGYDCVFLDRDDRGKALCRVYGSRPAQCRTWPFWKSNLRSRRDWMQAAGGCPGMNTGPLRDPGFIRVTRDRVEI